MPTIADVAKAAQVSKCTVSRVLNDKMVMPISPATIERVKLAAAELGYRPSALGRALATGKTHTIGLYYTGLTDPHFARMLQQVEAKARDLGYHLVVTSDPEAILAEGYVDGFLLMAPGHFPIAERLGRKPAVVFDVGGDALPNSVGWDDAEAGRIAAEYLLRRGHRRFAVIAGNLPASRPLLPKMLSFLETAQAHGASVREIRGTAGGDQIENGYLLTRAWLRDQPDVTAIYARNDHLAVGAMEALREAGIAIPRDVSVIGYGDTVLARCTYPRLTSIRTPLAEAGVVALERLVAQLDGGAPEFPGILLPVTLTERESCQERSASRCENAALP